MRKILISRKNLFAVLVCAAMLGVATPDKSNGVKILICGRINNFLFPTLAGTSFAGTDI